MKKVLFVLAFIIALCVPLTAGVNNDGSFSYSYPIELPPAIYGPTPQISLEYNSNTPNNLCGVGWTLNCGSMTITEDFSYGYNDRNWDGNERKYSTPWGIVEYIGDNEYQTRDMYSRTKFYFSGTDWSVVTEDGSKYTFEEMKSIDEDRHIYKTEWMLTSVSDRFDNSYSISYFSPGSSTKLVPESVSYGDERFKIKFNYEIRNDPVSSSVNGHELLNERLSEVVICVNGQEKVKHKLIYSEYTQGNKINSLLTGVTRSTDKAGEGDDTTTFDWNVFDETSQLKTTSNSEFSDTWKYDHHEDGDWPWSPGGQILYGRFDNDNKLDRIVVYRGGDDNEVFVYKVICSKDRNKKNEYKYDNERIKQNHHFGDNNFTTTVGDFDGNGLDDVLLVMHGYEYEYDNRPRSRSTNIVCFFSECDEYGEWSNFRESEFEGINTGNDDRVEFSDKTFGWSDLTVKPDVICSDFNNDGRTDFMIIANWFCEHWNGYKPRFIARIFLSKCYQSADFDEKFQVLDIPEGLDAKYEILTPDVNGDGCSDLVFARSSTFNQGREIVTYLASNSVYSSDDYFVFSSQVDTTDGVVDCHSWKTDSVYPVDSITYTDVNSDGLMDLVGFNTYPIFKKRTITNSVTDVCGNISVQQECGTTSYSGSEPPVFDNSLSPSDRLITNELSTAYGYIKGDCCQNQSLFNKISEIDSSECVNENILNGTNSCKETCTWDTTYVWQNTSQYADLNADGFGDRVSYSIPYRDGDIRDSIDSVKLLVQWGTAEGEYSNENSIYLQDRGDVPPLDLFQKNSWRMSLEDYNGDGLTDIVFIGINVEVNGGGNYGGNEYGSFQNVGKNEQKR
ncbi:MAG: hypothetical protein JXB48_06480 [Candidatus Latescibacteria bacterium]|nr:hypothetical protein [Candidatus Latescibacterota bacterium]